MSNDAGAPEERATYRALLAVGEYRALFGAAALSWIGDYLARAAVTALVYRDTHSAILAGAAFAIGYLPAIVGGPVLAALAERHPRRRVMITCDLGRLVPTVLIAVPGVPVSAMLALLFASALLSPPFDSARSALLPQLLKGDLYVLGVTVQQTTAQTTQIAGYALGGAIAAYDPRVAIALNAATFGVSALLLARGVRPRTVVQAERAHLLSETAAGFRVVFGDPLLRSIALTMFAVVAFAIVPEGIAVAWAGHLGAGALGQGLIMAAQPLGTAVGGIVLVRLLRPETRRALIVPLALVPPLVLPVALLDPSLPGVVAISLAGGLAMAGIAGPANALFVQVLPAAYRARAFGVMQGGLQIAGGIGVLTVGALAGPLGLTTAVALWGAVGVLLTTAIGLSWPSIPAPPSTAPPPTPSPQPTTNTPTP
ncbi:MFS transporter [Embleya sp. NBC_00896]|uniref:MFS transporter n=1 Tax=Embleya sp. NBC_00896 TaxID=2975961 RepID=UPI00386F296C|nr:MFS transporter [Embleya sp. NBC_00896]